MASIDEARLAEEQIELLATRPRTIRAIEAAGIGPDLPLAEPKPLNLSKMVQTRTKEGEDIVGFLLDVMLDRLKDGRKRIKCRVADRLMAADRLLDRGFGKAIQELAVTGADGGPIQTESHHIIAQMTREELIALAGDRLNRDLDHDSSATNESTNGHSNESIVDGQAI